MMNASTLQINLLGGFRLIYGDRAITSVTAKPLQLLLAYLVLHSDRAHSRKQLAATLFPNLSESEARTRLRRSLHRLHQAFPEIDQFLVADARTLRWKTELLYTLDVSEQEGSSLDLLPEFDDTWIQEKRNQLRQSKPQKVENQSLKFKVQNLLDWGDAPDVSLFYGRVEEVNILQEWVEQDHCRLVALLGMGGIGKTALAVKASQKLTQHFKLVIWRSLRNAPPLDMLLADLVPFLSRQQDTDARLSRLIHRLRAERCLIILDNVETILQGGERVGQYRAGYEDYGELFRCIAESSHQSSVIVTSREKPAEVGMFEGMEFKVRSLLLSGSAEAAIAILNSKGLLGTLEQKQQLCQLYSNNPLALKLVASSIQELFDGEISLFLEQNTVIFQTVRRLLEQQFQRLTKLEQTVMYWLAINREWTTIEELGTDLVPSVSRMKLLETLESLRWRSLIEKQSGKYTQQPVVMEYVSDRFTEQISSELITHEIDLFDRYALVKTTVKDYVRQSQFRLITDVIAGQLKAIWIYPEAIAQQIQTTLQCLREKNLEAGYGGGNLINLCYSLGIDLTNYNFANLSIRHACLQQINLHHANLSNTRFTQCLFNQNFSTILAVAFSPNDSVLATGDIKGQLCFWDIQAGQSLMMLQGHLSRIYSVAWHPHEQLLASGGDDQRIKIWDSQTGICLNILEGHRSAVWSLAWSPDGKILASSSNDRTIKLWNQSECIQTLEGHQNLVTSVAWSPNGNILATGSDDQTVKLWDVERGTCLHTLEVTGNLVRAIAWSPNNQVLATSANQDLLIRIWDTETGQCVQTLAGHSRQIYSLAWNPDGTQVASASDDGMIKLWNPISGQCLKTLIGHENGIWAIAWSHNGTLLASGSQDETIRLWEAETGQCFKTLQGYSSVVRCVNWSPDGKQLVSSSADKLVRVWDVDTGKCLKTLRGHQGWVFSAVWSPDGRTIASGSSDHTIKLWDTTTGRCLNTLIGHQCWIWSVAYSPNGAMLATGSSTNDLTIRIWNAHGNNGLPTVFSHELMKAIKLRIRNASPAMKAINNLLLNHR